MTDVNGFGISAMGLFSMSGLAAAAEQATDSNLTGIAAIIAASAGMVSALGAIWIATRPKPTAATAADNAKDELLLELLKEKLERERDEDQS